MRMMGKIRKGCNDAISLEKSFVNNHHSRKISDLIFKILLLCKWYTTCYVLSNIVKLFNGFHVIWNIHRAVV